MNQKIELQAEQMYTISLELSGQEIVDMVNFLKQMPYFQVCSAIKQLEEQLIIK